MKALFVNGSPRKNWNTVKLLKKAMEGAQESGAECELVNIYDKPFKGCVSCFACKIKNSKCNGLCAYRDDMRPLLESAFDADVIVVGSPVYFNGATAGTRAFLERLMFPIDTYMVDEDGKRINITHKPVKTAVIYDMNCPDFFMDQVNYRVLLGDVQHELERLFGYCEILYVNNTYQFSDYNRYDINMFPEEMKQKQLEEHFPIDLQNAYNLGKRLSKR
ncbi:MAG: flavodoxin family protein [Clostridia bacterium]|nr:flavodoxin family protein [Clostridia bacterium]